MWKALRARRLALWGAMGLLGALAAMLALGPLAFASDAEPPQDEADGPPEDEVPPNAITPRDPFTAYAADDAALAYDDLDDEEKASADRAALWAESEHGYDVHQRWSQAARANAAAARARRAGHAAGTTGLDELGVE